MTSSTPSISITEVGPRDGLQNESHSVPTDVKAAFIRNLIHAGLRDIEVSSFVRPDRIPQLADAKELFDELGKPPKGVTFRALVPNLRGLERAVDAGVRSIAVFTAASETFNRRNIGAGIDESLARFRPVVAAAKEASMQVRGYVSTAIHCPFEGPIDPEAVSSVSGALVELGCDELSIGDTIGAGTPAHVSRLLETLLRDHPDADLVMHFHDTRGMAIANVVESLRFGITRFDASAAGLGGCPYAPGASGNLATEDLVFLLDGLAYAHGIDLEALRRASRGIAKAIAREPASRVFQAPPLPGGQVTQA